MAKIKKKKYQEGLDSNGRFAKGNQLAVGNHATKNKPAPIKALKALMQAVKNVEAEKSKELGKPFSILEEFVRQAMTEKTILIALMKKLTPDLSQVTLGEDGTVSISFNIKDFRVEDKKATGEVKIS